MAIADVASRLYSSSAYRNTPVIKALADSVKMNLKFRFSLVGMAAALTGSETLYQIAQQKYLITDEEKKQAKEEIQFKKYVVTSISTLSKQVALIESITEKNSLMISAIASDLGYFKNQRKVNLAASYGTIKSFRVPVSSKTVKGRIDTINAEIAALKGIRLAEATSKQKEAAKKVEASEKDKRRGLIAAAVTSALAGTGLLAAGGGIGIAALGASAGALAGGALASQIGKQIVGTAIPIIGKALKISLIGGLALNAGERISKRASGLSGIVTGNAEDYINRINPTTDPLGYKLKQNEIEIRKSIDALFEEFSKPIDAALVGITTYLALSSAGEFTKFLSDKNFKLPKGRVGKVLEKILPGAVSTATASAAATSGAGIVAGLGGATGGLMSGTVKGGRIWTGTMWKTVAGASGGAAAATATKVPKLSAKLKLFLKGLSGAKGIAKFLKGPGALGAAGSAFYLANLYSMMGKYSDPPTEEFRNEFISNVSGLIGTGGATLIAGGLGLAVGGVPGLLLGGGAGLGLGYLSEGATTAMASTIFDLLFDMPSAAAAGVSTGNAPISAVATQGAAQAAVQFFVDRGYSNEVASAIVGNLIIESNLKPDAIGDSGKAYGIAQWHADRQAQFAQVYGKPIQQATFEEQLMFVDWELNNTESAAKQKIMVASAGGAGAAAAAVDKYYERSAGIHTAERMAVAGQLYASTYTGVTPQLNTQEAQTAMLAGSGLSSMLDVQLMDLFMKNSKSVETTSAEVDKTKAEIGTQMVAAALVQSNAQIYARMDKLISETQKQIDTDKLDQIAYVDDHSFDAYFKQPDFAKI